MSTTDTDKTVAAAILALASALQDTGAIGASVRFVRQGRLEGYNVLITSSTTRTQRIQAQALPNGVTQQECACNEEPPGTHVHFAVRL
jgi:acyl-coenzyme A thioesterase PaaI-like protein